MSESYYLISDASKKINVEAHVLRYWEEELEMNIPRNEMGHRCYSEFHIRLFRKIRELKEKGYQLKAIKAALLRSGSGETESVIPADILEEDVVAQLKECQSEEEKKLVRTGEEDPAGITEEKARQFKNFLSRMISEAMEENNESLSQDISRMVNERIVGEFDYLMRVADERDDERFRQLDETIRLCQKENRGRAEAAAARAPGFPFHFRKKKKTVRG